MGCDGGGGFCGNGKAEFAGKAYGAEYADRVFLITLGRIADDDKAFGADVFDAVVAVDDFLAAVVVIQGIAGEIAAGDVLFERAVGIVLHDAAVLVLTDFAAASESGDFDGFAADHDMDNLKAAADDAASAEQFVDLFWTGVGNDVVVFGLDAKQQVAHGTADQIGFIACLMELVEDFFGTGMAQRQRNSVADGCLPVCFMLIRHDAVEPFFEHVFGRSDKSFRQPEKCNRGLNTNLYPAPNLSANLPNA